MYVDIHLDAIQPRALLDQLEIGARSRPDVIHLDLSGIADIDTVGVAALRVATRRLAARGVTVELRGASAEVARMLAETPAVGDLAPPVKEGVLARVGELWLSWWRALVAVADMFLETVRGLVAAMFGRATFSLRDITDQVERMGVDSVPIVSSLSFLLGLVLAFQTWVQLQPLGAGQYVLQFVGIGMARGFAPFIVAVLVAGRTGSAIAAELATMEMRQENDALRVMGISPVRHLVVPRMIALTLVVPGVGVIATFAGIAGGVAVMVALSPNWMASVNRMLVGVDLADLWLGAVKSVLFAWTIGLASSFSGLRSSFGALSIGLAATRAVVSSIFFVMVVDAIVTTIWTAAQ